MRAVVRTSASSGAPTGRDFDCSMATAAARGQLLIEWSALARRVSGWSARSRACVIPLREYSVSPSVVSYRSRSNHLRTQAAPNRVSPVGLRRRLGRGRGRRSSAFGAGGGPPASSRFRLLEKCRQLGEGPKRFQSSSRYSGSAAAWLRWFLWRRWLHRLNRGCPSADVLGPGPPLPPADRPPARARSSRLALALGVSRRRRLAWRGCAPRGVGPLRGCSAGLPDRPPHRVRRGRRARAAVLTRRIIASEIFFSPGFTSTTHTVTTSPTDTTSYGLLM